MRRASVSARAAAAARQGDVHGRDRRARGIRPSPRFEIELEDPVLKRTLSHGYDVKPPIVV
jgi:hypothetical protein